MRLISSLERCAVPKRRQRSEKTMPRIAPVVSPDADSKVAATLSQLKASLGTIPNLFATSANSPAALDGYLSLSKTLSRGRLSPRRRELLALAIAQENECQYCLSAHTALAEAVGISATDALKARFGKSDAPFERALTSFAQSIVRQRGLVSDRHIEIARKSGIDDGLMLEIVANVALHTLTNYANRLADTEIDSPLVAE
jgi:uncharacterized peroxidase-related enzyme